MNVLYYSKSRSDVSHRLQKAIESIVEQHKLCISLSIDSLSRRLHQVNHNIRIAVMMIDSREDLVSLVGRADLFADIRLVLVLPDRKKHTISQAHLLGPRYLTYSDSNFEDVKAVLHNMQRAWEKEWRELEASI